MVEKPHDITSYTANENECDNPLCDRPADVIAPNGYVCRECADDDEVNHAG